MIDVLLAIALFNLDIFTMAAAQGTEELKLSIRIEKSIYALGESIFVEISLSNTGSKTIKLPKYSMLPADVPGKNNLEIQVHDASGKRLSRISHVLTGRALYNPDIRSLKLGETYRESFQLAGTFSQKQGRKKVKKALWSLGENPEITFASEYPITTQGRFTVRAIYRVDEQHLASLSPADASSVWRGQLISNAVEIVLS